MHAFRIGRIFGIEVRVDWSWVVIFVLMTWNLSAVFAAWHSSWSPLEQVGVAVVASVLFFGCILLHELAHSVVAMRFGVSVRSITLFLFGGVSNVEHEPYSAKAEFWTSIVGPVTSIALGLVFMVLASIATALSMRSAQSLEARLAELGPVATLLAWLGPINVIIGVFNMIPAFPLDGGRVLRSVLWASSGQLRKATRQASTVGQAIGWALILLGIAMSFGLRVPFLGTGLVAGLWLAFIGWFIRVAAAQATRRLAIDDALDGHVVAEFMRRDGPRVPPDMPLSSFVHDHLLRTDERALPVMRDDQFLGLVSGSDMRAIPTAQWPWTRVAAVMRPGSSLVVTTPDEPLASAFAQLVQRDVAQLPVLESGHLVGMLQRRDVARWLELVWRPPSGADPAPWAAEGRRPDAGHPARDPHPRSV